MTNTIPSAQTMLAERLYLQGHRCVLTAEDQAMIVAALRAAPPAAQTDGESTDDK